MKYVIDSHAWLEYFMGTDGGEKVKAIVDSEVNEKLTPSICLVEIYAKILRSEDPEKAELRRAFIKSRSALVVLGEELAVEAAKLDVVMKKRVPGWLIQLYFQLHAIGAGRLLPGTSIFEDCRKFT
ncbi:MAG: PIN domain-containing protein [Candidatus Bathyarchaeia archaeon]